NGSTSTTDYQFSWYEGISASGTPIEPNNSTASGLAAGEYTVEVTDLATGCSTIHTYRITDETVNPLEVVTTSTSNDRCAAPFNGVVAANLTSVVFGKATNDYKFAWNAGSTAPTFDVFDHEGQAWEELAGGEYTLVVFDREDPMCTSGPISVIVPD